MNYGENNMQLLENENVFIYIKNMFDFPDFRIVDLNYSYISYHACTGSKISRFLITPFVSLYRFSLYLQRNWRNKLKIWQNNWQTKLCYFRAFEIDLNLRAFQSKFNLYWKKCYVTLRSGGRGSWSKADFLYGVLFIVTQGGGKWSQIPEKSTWGIVGQITKGLEKMFNFPA